MEKGDLVVLPSPWGCGQIGIVVKGRCEVFCDVLWNDGQMWMYVEQRQLRVVQKKDTHTQQTGGE
jgi:hypothetical protein